MNNEKDTFLKESLNFLDFVRPWTLLDSPDHNGTFWASKLGIGIGYNSYLRIFNTAYFNLSQRYLGEYLWRTSPIAQSAIEQLTTFVCGLGFDYSSEDEATQAQLDEFLEENDWEEKQIELFQRLIVSGECFIRTNPGRMKVSIILPDYVQGGLESSDQQQLGSGNMQGIVRNPNDWEEIMEYLIKYPGDRDVLRVKADRMQHRKLGWASDARGIGLLYSVANHLMNAEGLIQALTISAKTQANIAVVREHESTKDSVAAFIGDIQGQPQNQQNNQWYRGTQPQENIENYTPGTVLDLDSGTTWKNMSEGLRATEFIEVLRATLRIIAARVGLNEHTLAQDQSEMAAYSASMVAESPFCRHLERIQNRIKNWDFKLFRMLGIDTEKVNAVMPEVVSRADKDKVQVFDFLVNSQICSKDTAAEAFDLDYEDEQEKIKTEPQPEMDLQLAKSDPGPFQRDVRGE